MKIKLYQDDIPKNSKKYYIPGMQGNGEGVIASINEVKSGTVDSIQIDDSSNNSTQNKKSVKIFKSGKNSAFKTQEEGKKVYEDRMKQVAKDIKKSMRMLKKPQYSDKSYFGHNFNIGVKKNRASG